MTRAKSRARLVGVGVLLVGVVLPSDGLVGVADAAAAPAVTLEGPAELRDGFPPCDDAGYFGEADLTIRASEPPTTDIEVALAVGGDAVADEDYERLPESVTVDDTGVATVTLRILDGPAFDKTLVVSLEPGAGYTVGDPSSLTIHLIRYDGRCEPPTFTDAATNRAQTIETGESLAALDAVPFEDHGMFFELESGVLPPGITLHGDGTFAGAARAAGIYTSVIAACTPVFGRLCSTTELTTTVMGAPLPEGPKPCSARQLVEESDAVFPHSMDLSVDGRRAIVHDDGFGGLLLVDTAIGAVSPIPSIDDFQLHSRGDLSRISADGLTVVFSARQSGLTSGLFRYDVASGETTRFDVPGGVIRGIEVSADGRIIAFAQDDPSAEQVFRLDRDTGALQQLTAFTDKLADGHLLDITSDGRVVLLSQSGPNADPGQLFVSRDGGPLEPAGSVAQGVTVELRPDGKSVLEIAGAFDGEGPTVISFRSLDDGSVTEQASIPGHAIFGASHSPFERAFRSTADLTGHNGDASAEVFSLELRTGQLLQLTDVSGGSPGMVVGGMTADGNKVLVSSDVDLTDGSQMPRDRGPAVFLLDCGAAPLARTG